MHRRSMRAALVSVATVAALTLAACGSQTQGGDSSSAASSAATSAASSSGSASASGSASSSAATSAGGGTGDLLIKAEFPIDKDGNEVPVPESGGTPAKAGRRRAARPAPASRSPWRARSTGANAALGLNILYGANVAIKEHNEANPDCQVELKQFDTEGDPQKATQVAPQIVGDQSVIGLLGPAFSGETEATGPIFFQAGLLSLTASATRTSLTSNGWTNFFRGLASDAVQGPAVANYLVKGAGYTKVCVVTDDSAYGKGLADEMAPVLGDAADSSCAAEVKTGDKDFSAAVQLINAAAPDAIFYAGYYAEAAPFVQQLRDAGVTAVFVSGGRRQRPAVRRAGRRRGRGRDPVLPVRSGSGGVRRDLRGAQRPGPRRLLGGGLRPHHDHADGHRLRYHRPGGADRVRARTTTVRVWPATTSGTRQGELEASVIWIYKVQ